MKKNMFILGLFGLAIVGLSALSVVFSLDYFFGEFEEYGEIAFIRRWGERGNEIYLAQMNLYPQNPYTEIFRLTIETIDADPAWSRDGKQLAVSRVINEDLRSNMFIYIMDADGSNVRRVTNDDYYAAQPSWSPDGEYIAFDNLEDDQVHYQIYIVDINGENYRKLSDDMETSGSPDWSPDGTEIAFVGRDEKKRGIFIINADGTNLRQLTDGIGGFPHWSPDGTKIAFVYSGIHIINRDGTDVSHFEYEDIDEIDWSPDGQYLVGDGVANELYGLHIIDVNTGEIYFINGTGGGDYQPAWRPVPTLTITPQPE